MSSLDERIDYYREFTIDDMESRLASGVLGPNSQILCKSLINEKCGTLKYDVPTVDEIREASLTSIILEKTESSESNQQNNHSLVGIDGWLIFPAIGLISGILFGIVGLALGLFTYFEYATKGFGGLYIIRLTGMLTLTLFMIYAAIAFFKKKRSTPRILITLVIANIMFLSMCVVIDAHIHEDIMIGASDVWGLIFSVISAAIWIPYYLVSKRVRATFVS